MVAAYVHIALKCFERVSCGADLFDSRGIGLLGGCKIGSVLSYCIGWAASLVCRSTLPKSISDQTKIAFTINRNLKFSKNQFSRLPHMSSTDPSKLFFAVICKCCLG